MSEFRTITEIITDSANTNRNRALECLRGLDNPEVGAFAAEKLQTAAQVFATLALADEVTWESNWWRQARG